MCVLHRRRAVYLYIVSDCPPASTGWVFNLSTDTYKALFINEFVTKAISLII